MKKKAYIQPQTEIVKVMPSALLAASDPSAKDYIPIGRYDNLTEDDLSDQGFEPDNDGYLWGD